MDFAEMKGQTRGLGSTALGKGPLLAAGDAWAGTTSCAG